MVRSSAARLLLLIPALFLCTPVSAQASTGDLATIRQAMAGQWAGQVSGTDASSGETYEEDDEFTIVLTGDDKLDSITWSAQTVELASYEDDCCYQFRTWNAEGHLREIRLQVDVDSGPDSDGNGSYVLEGTWEDPNGVLTEARERWFVHGDDLGMTIEMRPAGTEAPFTKTVTGSWSRKSPNSN